MSDPDILVIDELSLGLARIVYQLSMTLKNLKEAGLTILLVEQNVHLALAVSDYAYVIAEGACSPKARPSSSQRSRKSEKRIWGCNRSRVERREIRDQRAEQIR